MVIFGSESLILKKTPTLLKKKILIHLWVLFSINKRKKVCSLVQINSNYFHGWVEKGPFQVQQSGNESL